MLESTFKLKEREYFESKGWKFIQLDPGGGSGVPMGFPDTLCLSPNGYSCYVEWKQHKNSKKQPLQQYWNTELNNMRHDAFFVYPENVGWWRNEILGKGGSKWLKRSKNSEHIG